MRSILVWFCIQANEMLLFGRKITAKKACDWGLVTEVFPDRTFDEDIEARLKEIADLPKQVPVYLKFVSWCSDLIFKHETKEVVSTRYVLQL